MPHPPVAAAPARQRRRSTTRRAARHVGADAELSRRAARPRRRDDLFPRAQHQQLQALRRRHLRADQDGLVDRQPHRGFRLCGEGTQAVRVECRIGGADLNPYLAFAAQIAAGLAGIERGLELGAGVQRRRLRGGRLPRDPEDAARGDRGAAALDDAARRASATRSSSTTSTPLAGSSPNSTAASPTGRSPAASSARERRLRRSDHHERDDPLHLADRRQRLCRAAGRGDRERAGEARGRPHGAEGLGRACRSTSGSRWCARAWPGSTG